MARFSLSLDRSKLLRAAGYSAFFSFAFLVMLYVTFPYSIVTERLQAMAAENRYSLTIGSLGPGLFGIKAKNVSILLPPKDLNEPQAPLTLSAVTVRPSLFPLGVAYTIAVPGGNIQGAYGLIGQRRFTANGKLNLAQANLGPVIGLDFSGNLNLTVDLALDRATFMKTTGRIVFTADNAALEGGKVSGFTLPKVGLGRLEGNIQLGQGKADFKTFRAQGGDLEAAIEGDIALADQLLMSNLRLKLKIKPKDEFLDRNPTIKGALSLVGKDAQGGYTIAIERALGNPNFRPTR